MHNLTNHHSVEKCLHIFITVDALFIVVVVILIIVSCNHFHLSENIVQQYTIKNDENRQQILKTHTLGANARKERHKSLATVFTLLMYLERAEFHHKPKDEDNQANVRHQSFSSYHFRPLQKANRMQCIYKTNNLFITRLLVYQYRIHMIFDLGYQYSQYQLQTTSSS